MILERILTLIANLIPLAGVWWWGWDVFQILVLYWMQTVLVVAWMLLHLHKLSRDKLGDITVNGRVRPATRRDLLFVFGATGFAFCGAHLLFLWLFFSGDWSKLVRGPASFWQHMVIASGAWLPLLVNVVAGAASYLLAPPRSAPVRRIAGLFGVVDREVPEDLGNVVGTMLGRVVLMQVAIIFGAMFARGYGTSMAPLLILIGLKTLSDLSGSSPLHGATVTVNDTRYEVK
jgi:Family of unknown function (DUF6498)